jgi:hypothetical protein
MQPYRAASPDLSPPPSPSERRPALRAVLALSALGHLALLGLAWSHTPPEKEPPRTAVVRVLQGRTLAEEGELRFRFDGYTNAVVRDR